MASIMETDSKVDLLGVCNVDLEIWFGKSSESPGGRFSLSKGGCQFLYPKGEYTIDDIETAVNDGNLSDLTYGFESTEVGINVIDQPDDSGVGITIYQPEERAESFIRFMEKDIVYFEGDLDFPWWFEITKPTAIEFTYLR